MHAVVTVERIGQDGAVGRVGVLVGDQFGFGREGQSAECQVLSAELCGRRTGFAAGRRTGRAAGRPGWRRPTAACPTRDIFSPRSSTGGAVGVAPGH